VKSISFDEAEHAYWVEGSGESYRVPSHSKIIRTAGLEPDFSMVPPKVLKRKVQIGVVVHDAIEAMLLGYEIDAVPPEAAGYIRSALTVTWPFPIACMARTDAYKPSIDVERPMLGSCLGIEFGCRPDLVTERIDGPGVIVEWKTSTKIHVPAVKAQLGAQMIAAGLDTADLVVYRLDKDGKPPERLDVLRSDARRLFEAAVTIYAEKTAAEPKRKKRGADNA
jgi:hypothetical protein